MRHPTPTILAAIGIAVLIAGCGISDPYHPDTSTRHAQGATGTTPTTATTVSNPEPAPEQGGTIPPAAQLAQAQLAAGAAQPTPQAALERYANLYINWTATTVASVQRALASISLGQARAQALQAAASYKHDSTLLASGVSSTGAVVAITPSLTTPGEWVIVTSETTSGQGDYAGLPASLHVTYAQLEHTTTGWLVELWAPQT